MTSEAFWHLMRALISGALLGVPAGFLIAHLLGVI